MAEQQNWQRNQGEPNKDAAKVTEREPALTGGSIGKTEPDRSKEHNTEIAVEQGRKGREKH
jgi:hypothetical protein